MIRDIYNYVNYKLKIDIAEKTNKREYAEARALYYHLCREHTNNSLTDIARIVNKNHCAVLHAQKNIYPYITNKLIKKAYNEFNEIDLTSGEIETVELTKLIKNLQTELKAANEKIETLNQLEGLEIIEDLKGLNPEQLEKANVRIKAMVNMIKKERTYNIVTK